MPLFASSYSVWGALYLMHMEWSPRLMEIKRVGVGNRQILPRKQLRRGRALLPRLHLPLGISLASPHQSSLGEDDGLNGTFGRPTSRTGLIAEGQVTGNIIMDTPVEGLPLGEVEPRLRVGASTPRVTCGIGPCGP